MIILCAHIGAGKYGKRTKRCYFSLLQNCLKKGIESYKHNSQDLIEIAKSILTSLEDSGLVNTGKGSSLTDKLQIECDAIMIRSSDCAMGVVVASPDNQNPSTTAAFLLKESTLGLEAQQLLRPCILVGQAATEYAKQNKIFKSCRISEKRLQQGSYYQSLLYPSKQPCYEVEDTVGCIVYSDDDIVVAGSSGGNWMRHSGRGGLCSVPGAGVWCEETSGCVCSGYGECCIRVLLAKRICDILEEEENKEECIKELLEKRLKNDMKKMKIDRDSSFGILSLYRNQVSKQLSLIIAHTSTHFAYGYVILQSPEETGQIMADLLKTNNSQCNIVTIDL